MRAEFAREPFEARGEIDRVADDGVIEAALAAEISDDHLAGRDTDSDIETLEARIVGVEFLQFHQHAERLIDRDLRMIGQSLGAPQNAMMLSPRILSTTPPLSRMRSVMVVMYSLSIVTNAAGSALHALGKRGVIHDVGEQDGEHLALSA